MDERHFGLRLKELREAAGLTQPQLADQAGLSKGGVADLEQGRNEPSWATVLRLADALGVVTDDFRRPPAATTTSSGRGRPRKAPAAAKPKGKKK